MKNTNRPATREAGRKQRPSGQPPKQPMAGPGVVHRAWSAVPENPGTSHHIQVNMTHFLPRFRLTTSLVHAAAVARSQPSQKPVRPDTVGLVTRGGRLQFDEMLLGKPAQQADFIRLKFKTICAGPGIDDQIVQLRHDQLNLAKSDQASVHYDLRLAVH